MPDRIATLLVLSMLLPSVAGAQDAPIAPALALWPRTHNSNGGHVLRSFRKDVRSPFFMAILQKTTRIFSSRCPQTSIFRATGIRLPSVWCLFQDSFRLLTMDMSRLICNQACTHTGLQSCRTRLFVPKVTRACCSLLLSRRSMPSRWNMNTGNERPGKCLHLMSSLRGGCLPSPGAMKRSVMFIPVASP